MHFSVSLKTKIDIQCSSVISGIVHVQYIINMKEGLCMFMTTVIKCHSLNYDIFLMQNALV